MAKKSGKPKPFNVMIVGQNGRIAYEAALFAASLRHADPDFAGRILVAEPQPGPNWDGDPRIQNHEIRTLLDDHGAEIVPFETRHFGASYPEGNKIEGLFALPKGEPFVFFDSDTLVTGKLSGVPFDFARPCASLRREGTWPQPELYGPGYHEIWTALYDKFALDIGPTIDLAEPEDYWRRYMYFNAGWFFYRCPHEFGQRFLDYALAIKSDPPKELIGQELYPWLDQIVLPLVIHSLGGARRTIPEGLLDGKVTCHYRVFPLLYAREADAVVDVLETVTAPNKIKKVLKTYDPIRRMIYQRRGHKVRALFDRDHLPAREQMIRNKIKREKLWMR
ncbi:MAG: hypothetical protein QNJ44_14575 [Rhodobacter sp.]|nr:hypothetical protein [Rhodobacter sp.]